MQTYTSSSKASQLLALLIAAIIAISIAIRFALNLGEGLSIAGSLWKMTRWFTILTNLAVCFLMLRIAMSRPVNARLMLAMSAAIAGVGIIYHTMLAHLLNQVGIDIWANHGVHTAAPVLTVIWFVAFGPREQLRWRDAAWALPWPILYAIYAFTRGFAENSYPYPFIDANKLPLEQIAVNVVGLAIAFGLLALLLIAARRGMRKISEGA